MAGIRNGGNSRFAVMPLEICPLQVTLQADGRRMADLPPGTVLGGGEELKKRFPMLQVMI